MAAMSENEEKETLETAATETSTEETKSKDPTVFKDRLGVEWHPRLDAPAIIKATSLSGLTIRHLMTVEVPIADMVRLIWFCCEYQAEQEGLSQDAFLKRLNTKAMVEGMKAVWACLERDFPEMQQLNENKKGDDTAENPFDLGKRMTSILSRPLPE